MTSQLDSHMQTDVKPDMLSGVQTGNGVPHDAYDIRGITHAHTNTKDDIFMQRRLYIDKAHTALDILRFAVFLMLRMQKYGRYSQFPLTGIFAPPKTSLKHDNARYYQIVAGSAR